MNFSFTQPFIQCILNANSVPGFVREASTLALGFPTFCFQARSLCLITSQAFFLLSELMLPNTPWIWAVLKGKTGFKVGLVGGFSILFCFDAITVKFMETLGQGSNTETGLKTPTFWRTAGH